MPVGVIGEPDRPVLRHHGGGRVEQNHLNRSRQLHADGLLPCDRRQDAFPGPLGLVLQDPFGQRHRILDAHAPVAEVAAAARKERLGRRAVQVTPSSFGNTNLMRPSAFPGPGRWRRRSSPRQPLTFSGVASPRRGIVPGAPDEFHVLSLQIVRVSRHRRQNLVRTMDRGTFQVRRKITFSICSTKTGVCVSSAARPTITPMPSGGAPLGGIESRVQSRNIGMLMSEEGPVAEIGKPPQPLQGQLDLSNPPCKGNTESGERSPANHAILQQTVARLKPADAGSQRALISPERWRGRVSRQIAQGRELTIQRVGPIVAIARPNRDGR